MSRSLRALFACGLLAAAISILPTGCAGPGGNGVNPLEGKACNTATDCGDSGLVCDLNVKICFKDCTTQGATCDPGNVCDKALKRCVCDKPECKEPTVSDPGCHPILNVCRTKCDGNDDCADPTKCVGTDNNKFCVNPASGCKADADCKDPTKPKCDTTKNPAVCIATTDACAADADCKVDGFKKCNTAGSPKVCVACMATEDCPAGSTCKDNKCEAPPACVDDKLGQENCVKADPKGFCDEATKDKGCGIAGNCSEGKPVTEANSNWEDQIKVGEGSIIWGAQASDKGPDNRGCKKIVEVKFKYYNTKGAFNPSFFSYRTHSGTRKAGQIYDKPSIVAGDKTYGTALFTMCFKSSTTGTFQFWTTDVKKGKQSNIACYAF